MTAENLKETVIGSVEDAVLNAIPKRMDRLIGKSNDSLYRHTCALHNPNIIMICRLLNFFKTFIFVLLNYRNK